jgi:hypothetical protein
MYFTTCAPTLLKAEVKFNMLLDELLKRANLESAPQSVLRRAERVFDGSKPAAPSSGTLRKILASLVFDSLTQPSLAGARGTTTTMQRQLVLRAEGFDIHLKMWGVTPSRRIAGQILSRGESSFVSSARLHLIRDGERYNSTTVDKFGEFEFEKVPEGFLSLQIDLPHLTVVGTLNSSEAA